MLDPISRVIFITEVEQFGGAERSLLALARWFHDHQVPHYLLTYVDHCNIAQYATTPLQVISLTPARGLRHKVASLRKHLKEHHPGGLALLCSGYQPALHSTLAGIRGFHCLMHDTPSLFGDQDSRNFTSKLRIRISNMIIGRGLRSGGTTVVTSEYLRSECRKDFQIESSIARMGGLSQRPRPAQRPDTSISKSSDAFNMLSVCRIEPNKRIHWILRALSDLERGAVGPFSVSLSKVVDWHLHLAGSGSLIPQLSQLARSLGIDSRVHFHGFVSDDQLECLYDEANLFLMPAVQGYGIPAIEAVGRSIPVLLHRQSGVSDIFLDTPWAFVLHGDENELPAVLAKAISGVFAGAHLKAVPPELPTEEQWARRVAELCHLN